MKKFLLLALAVGAASASQAITMFQWDFDSVPNDASTQTGTDVAAIAVNPGSAVSRIGGVGFGTTQYTSGVGSTDPNTTDNTAYHTTAYPAVGVGSGTAGVQFKASTAGYKDIKLSFDRRQSSTSSRWIQVQYTTDGTTYNPFANYEIPGFTLVMVNGATADFSSITGANNNPNFGIRIVTIFGTVGAAGGSSYATVGQTSAGGTTYSVNGTIRYDMVTFTGTAVPEPGSFLALGAGALILAARRRSR